MQAAGGQRWAKMVGIATPHIKLKKYHDLAMAMDLSKIMATAGVAVLVLKVCGCL